MKLPGYETPKSSFLSLQKDLEIITNKFMKNERLKRLLHYTTRDALNREDLSEEESVALFKKNIKLVPKLYIDGSVLNYIIISCDNFTPNVTNPQFRDNVISFDIICHFDQWELKDFQLRPYMIAGEIDSMLDGKHLTGIGDLQFLGANQLVLNDEFAGISLMYQTIHGGEDKMHQPNPMDETRFLIDYEKMLSAD